MPEEMPLETQPNQAKSEMLAHQSPFKKWAGLAVLTLGLAIVIIDTTLLNVSLSYIIKDLHTDIQSLQWVITAYALVLAALTITGGRLGDLFGRRKMFMLGAIIFAIGSFMASVSHNIPILLLGESIIEGFGAALMMPATASLVVANFHGKDRATAFGVWGGAAGASAAIGPLLGGYLTTHYSWRWGFRINVFVAALVIIGSLLLLKESRDERKPTLDWWGVVLSVIGLLGITFGIIESSSYGWWKAKQAFVAFGHSFGLGGYSIVPLSIALGVIFLGLFLWWEKQVEARGKSPLVSFNLFKNRQFTSSSVTVAVLTLAMTGLIFALPIYLQSVKGLDAFHTGLAMLPLSASLLIVAPLAGFLSKKITPKTIIQFGLFIDIIAAMVLHFTLSANTTVAQLIPGLALYGAGMGMVFAPISNITLSAVPVAEAGEASGVNNTLRQVGSTLGAAIIGAAVLASFSSGLAKGINASPVIPDDLKPAIVQKVANPNSNIEFGGATNVTGQLPPAVTTEIKSLANEATANASRDAYVYAAMFAALAFAISLFLPKTDVHAHENGQSLSLDDGNHSRVKWATAAAIMLIAVAGGVALLRNSSKITIASKNTPSIEDIANNFRNAFGINNNQPTNPNQYQPQSNISPRGSSSSAINSYNPNNLNLPATSTPPQIQPQVYSNPTLGFSLNIAGNWQAAEDPNNSTVTFTSSTGEMLNIQVYKSSSENLDTIQQQLLGSPNVTEVHRTTFKGQVALAFTSNGSYRQGLAIMNGNNIYYIFWTSGSNLPLSSFNFL